jgi:hypothetical protein
MNPLTPYEEAEQRAFFRWVDFIQEQIPVFETMFAIPNGGHRNRIVAAKLKGQGVRHGVADIFWPLPAGPYHGLFIEMKRADGGGRVSPDQERFIASVRRLGYKAVVCHGCAAAQDAALEYYELSRTAKEGRTP